jgi:hypothetical protein
MQAIADKYGVTRKTVYTLTDDKAAWKIVFITTLTQMVFYCMSVLA